MDKYTTVYVGSIDRTDDNKAYTVMRKEDGYFFRGYDFMGSVNWDEKYDPYENMTKDEAQQIISDLVSADEPAGPSPVRSCSGYEIVRSIQLDPGHEIVIGRHPSAPASYVCWDCTNGNDYNNGAYCLNFRQALLVLAERITNRYDLLPVEA